MRRPLLAIATALAFVTACPCIAHSSDDNGLAAGQPLIYGKVTRITSHTVVVLTRDGESLPIEFDSRTVMTTSMPTNCRVRVEFRLLDNGRYLAQRITPLERGSEAWAAVSARHISRSHARSQGTAPALYSQMGTDAPDATTDQSASNVTETESGTGTDATTEAGSDAAVASAEGGKPSSSVNPLPVFLVIGLVMIGGLLLLRRGSRRRT